MITDTDSPSEATDEEIQYQKRCERLLNRWAGVKTPKSNTTKKLGTFTQKQTISSNLTQDDVIYESPKKHLFTLVKIGSLLLSAEGA